MIKIDHSPTKALKLTEDSPFQFTIETGVVSWTGYIAEDLSSLLQGLRVVPESSIYYHVHHAIFRRPKYTWAQYTNDFARWVFSELGQKVLAERLSSIDPLELSTLFQCRERLVAYAQEYAAEGEVFPRVPPGRELYFMEAKSFVFPADIQASDVQQLARGIERMGKGGVLYHFIEARFRDGKGTNDFSQWLRLQGEEEKAKALEQLNPYFYDLETMKDRILEVLWS